jgi:prevent-host-death family protein
MKVKSETLSVTEARKKFTKLLRLVRAGETEILVQTNKIPMAALIAMESYDELKRQRKIDAQFAVIDRIIGAFSGVPNLERVAAMERLAMEIREDYRRGDKS